MYVFLRRKYISLQPNLLYYIRFFFRNLLGCVAYLQVTEIKQEKKEV